MVLMLKHTFLKLLLTGLMGLFTKIILCTSTWFVQWTTVLQLVVMSRL